MLLLVVVVLLYLCVTIWSCQQDVISSRLREDIAQLCIGMGVGYDDSKPSEWTHETNLSSDDSKGSQAFYIQMPLF